MQKQAEYSEATRNKYPQPVVIVITKDKNGRANPVTIGCTMITSYEPPMIAVAIAAKHYSTEAIRSSKCFTISYPSTEMADAAMFFGTHSGRDTDKLAEFKCDTAKCVKIDSVLLGDAEANFECTFESETVTGDHVIFVGKVVASHVNTERKKRLYTIGSGHKLGSV